MKRRNEKNVLTGRLDSGRGLVMKIVLVKVLIWPLIIIVTIFESLLKFVIKINTMVSGLLINILLICVVVSICTKQWISLGILIVMGLMDIGLIYGQATLLHIFSEAKEFLQGKG